MNSTVVHSLDDLVSAIVKLWENEPGWLWFRGHRDSRWDLLPSVRRDYTFEQERYMSNRFYARARTRHHNCPDNDDWAGWLSLMQHYGLPTRLLDWSESPFIAAFFATHEYLRAEQVETKAASIWVVDAIKLNVAQGFEPVAPPLNAKVVEPLVRPAIKGGEETGKVTAAMAVENDPRMQVQQGAFTVHTTDRPLNEMVGCDEWLHEFIIPLDAAKRIAWQLDILGVRVSQLFPDLHNLANELRNDYLPPGKKT